MNEFIKGYQWSPETKEYMGEYRFPNNKDKEEIHMPPFTTLKKPPECPKHNVIIWSDDEWVITSKVIVHPPIQDYSFLRQEFIDDLKEEGSWTDEDEQKYNDAVQKIEDDQNRYQEELDYDQEFRFIRNELIMRSDWTQLPDVQNKFTSSKKEEWIEHRQKLRDLPENIEDPKPMVLDPNHPDWPVSPE